MTLSTSNYQPVVWREPSPSRPELVVTYDVRRRPISALALLLVRRPVEI